MSDKHKPGSGYEVRVYDGDAVDGVLAHGPMNVHFEDMGSHFWGRIDLYDGRSLIINFHPESRKPREGGRCVRMTVEEDKIGGKSWGFKEPRKAKATPSGGGGRGRA